MLAETALTGLQRYEWRLLAPLLHSLIDAVLADFGGQEAEVGAVREGAGDLMLRYLPRLPTCLPLPASLCTHCPPPAALAPAG